MSDTQKQGASIKELLIRERRLPAGARLKEADQDLLTDLRNNCVVNWMGEIPHPDDC